MKVKAKNEYELDENLFVLHNILLNLYDRYDSHVSENISSQLRKLVDDTDEYSKKSSNLGGERYDAVEEKLFMKVKYIDAPAKRSSKKSK